MNFEIEKLIEWLKDEGTKLFAISLTIFFVTGFCAGYVACEKVAESLSFKTVNSKEVTE